MHKSPFILFFLLTSSIFWMGCGNGESPLTKTFGVSGTSYCDETHQIFDKALSIHLSKTQEQQDEIYTTALKSSLVALRGAVLQSTFDPSKAEQDYKRVHRALFSSDQFLDASAHLTDCSDLVALQDFYARHSMKIVDPSSASTESEAPSSPMIFKLFLSKFGEQLDPFSGYISQGTAKASGYSFGVSLDLHLQEWYDQKSSEVEVFATDEGADQPLKVHDRILAVSEPAAEPNYSEGTFTSIRNLFEKVGIAGLQPIFSRSNRPYLSVKVQRAGTSKEEVVSLFRRESNHLPLVSTEILDGHIIYVRLKEFSSGAAPELVRKISEAKKQIQVDDRRMDEGSQSKSRIGIILDLRWNPGGDLDEMKPIAALFIGAGEVGTMRTREGLSKIKIVGSAQFDEPLVLLVNHASASASDLLTQVLKETGRAYVIGENSFGKGIGQYVLLLGQNSNLGGGFAVTAFQFYGPSGKSIYLVGNTPDLTTNDEAIERLKNNCKDNCRPLHMSDHLKRNHYLPPPSDPVSPTAPLSRVSKTQVEASQIAIIQKTLKTTTSSSSSSDIVLETGRQVMTKITEAENANSMQNP